MTGRSRKSPNAARRTATSYWRFRGSARRKSKNMRPHCWRCWPTTAGLATRAGNDPLPPPPPERPPDADAANALNAELAAAGAGGDASTGEPAFVASQPVSPIAPPAHYWTQRLLAAGFSVRPMRGDPAAAPRRDPGACPQGPRGRMMVRRPG